MKAYLITMLVVFALEAIAGMLLIAACEYPRKREPRTLGQDVAQLVSIILFAAWTIYLLCNYNPYAMKVFYYE